MNMLRPLHTKLVLTWTACALACLNTARATQPADAPPACTIEDVLRRYPSAENVAEQVRALDAASPGLVKTILEDFDLSIRASLKYPPPRIGGWPRDETVKVTPGYSMTESYLKDSIAAYRNEPDRSRLSEPDRLAVANYYEAHFDEFAVKDYPELPLVMMYVLSQDWQDWSAWDPTNERLNLARQRFPDLHRINAIDYLAVMRHQPATGLLLQVVLSEEDTLCSRALFALETFGDYEDLLNVYIAAALDPSASDKRRGQFFQEIMRLTQQRGKAPAYWAPYLDSDVPTLWFCAQKAFDRPLPDDPFGWLRRNQRDWNICHEPDPKVRERLGYEVRLEELLRQRDPETDQLLMKNHPEIEAIKGKLKELEKDIDHTADD